MSKIKPEQADGRTVLRGFDGIRCDTLLSENGAEEVRNFRILPDGSLEKRDGTVIWQSLGGSFRGCWEGSIEGASYFFAVCGNTVYGHLPGGEVPVPITTITSTEGEVEFATFRGRLYLFDGVTVLRFLPNLNAFSVVYGYAPLYGKDWAPTQMGAVNEPMNMLSPRIRLQYINVTAATTFYLPFTTASINRMTVNGTPVTNYSFTPNTSRFTIPSSYAYGTLEVAVTLASVFSQRSLIAGAKRKLVYADGKHETMLAYGGSSGYRIYYTANVTDEMLAKSAEAFNEQDPLYFPVGSAFLVGDDQHPVTALCRNRDRVLAFNSRAVWGLEHADDGDEMVIYPIDGGAGCISPHGLAVCDDEPVVIREDGIYSLEFPSGNPDLCRMTCISEAISDRLGSNLANCILFWNAPRAELWLRDPAETENGIVHIRNRDRGDWVSYDHVGAKQFFRHAGSLGFVTSQGDLILFSPSVQTDLGLSITSFVQSHYRIFDHPEDQNRSYRVTVCADTGGDSPTLLIETEHDQTSYQLTGRLTSVPEYFDQRLASGRFRFLRYRLSVTGNAKTRIFYLSVLTNR